MVLLTTAVLASGAISAVDHLTVHPYEYPKFVVLIATALVVMVLCIRVHSTSGALAFSVIEVILASRIVWAVVTNPEWATNFSSYSLPIMFALLMLSATIRARTHDELARLRWIDYGMAMIWVNGAAQGVLGFQQAYYAGGMQFESALAKTPMHGTIGPPNAFGLLMAVSVVAAYFHTGSSSSRKVRAAAAISVVICAAALVANASRGAALGLAVAVAAVVILKRYSSHERVVPVVRMVREMGIAIVLLAGLSIALYHVNEASSVGRLRTWRISTSMLLNEPVFGIGKDRFGVEFVDYQGQYFSEPRHLRHSYKATALRHPHSEYLLAAVETGIVGGIIFGGIFISAIMLQVRQVIRSNLQEEEIAILSVLLLVSVHAAVDNVLHSVPIALLTHIVIGLVYVPRRSPLFYSAKSTFTLVVSFIMVTCFLHSLLKYPALRVWGSAFAHSGFERVDRLAAAQRKLPGNAELAADHAHSLVEIGSYKEAIPLLVEAAEKYNLDETYLMLSEAYLNTSQPDSAVLAASRAASMFPDRLRPRIWLAKAFHANGDRERARVLLSSAARGETYYDTLPVRRAMKSAQLLEEALFMNESNEGK